MTTYWAERAWLPDGVATGVLLEVGDGGSLRRVEAATDPPPAGAVVLRGLTLPGLVDTHSHAFHRALRGRATGADFWTWRRAMYDLVDRLDPPTLLALATASFAELVLAGVTTVHEFHYLHHPEGPEGGMDHAVVEAARRAGLRLVLLDTCYLRSGFGDDDLDPVQRRFSDGDVGRWAERAEQVAAAHSEVTVGAAIHSVRALDPTSMAAVAAWARERDAPLHLHLSEQPAENAACLEATGHTPTELAHQQGVLGSGTTAVHATHLTGDDVDLLGSSGTTVCLCPTTERDLADGVGPSAALAAAGCPLRLGSDSHAVADLFEEARAVELHQRLVTGRRGHHSPAELLHAATGGARLAEGEPADLCVVALDTPRLAGADPEDHVGMVVAAATAADVRHVVVAGRLVVEEGVHATLDVAGELDRAIGALR